MHRLSTCRLCGLSNYESAEEMLRYGKGSRSNVHPSCALNRWGVDGFFERVKWHQFGKVSWHLAQEHGILDRLRTAMEQNTQKGQSMLEFLLLLTLVTLAVGLIALALSDIAPDLLKAINPGIGPAR
jgi:hypothetical protein